ncbi:MAG: hypothetical protein K940chlam6_01714, partial [Chlamydiae bacterium]|nr:hypothetical protein [Chlamydiota bacterium]
PHFGLKGTWQKQKWDVVDTGIDSIQSTLITFADLDLDYWGIGIRTGLDSAWHFTPCFSLLGEVAIAALWERFDSETKIFTHDITAGSFVVELFIENAFHSIHSVLELYLGLRFENWFCCNEYHWSIEGGWEIQWWADQNKFFFIPGDLGAFRGGDLGLQGFTLKVRLDF